MLLTATSALPFDLGLYAADNLWLIHHLDKKSAVSFAMNSGPPSELISCGTSKVANHFFSDNIKPAAPDVLELWITLRISGQLLKGSSMIK